MDLRPGYIGPNNTSVGTWDTPTGCTRSRPAPSITGRVSYKNIPLPSLSLLPPAFSELFVSLLSSRLRSRALSLSRFLSRCGGEFTWFQFVALICRCSCNGMFFCCVTHVDFAVTSHTKVNRYHASWRLLLLGVRLINRGLDANSFLSLSLAAATVAADACYFLCLCEPCKRPTSDIGTTVLSSVRYQTWYRADDNRSEEA